MSKVVAIDTCAIIHFMYINKFRIMESLKYYPITTEFVKLEFDNGHQDSREYFYTLVKNGKIRHIPLEVDDLIMMARHPKSKKASNAELSCFVMSQKLGCKSMTDDERAIKYAVNILGLATSDILRLIDILFEAYFQFLLGDDDLENIQKILAANNFTIKGNLHHEAARRRLMSS